MLYKYKGKDGGNSVELVLYFQWTMIRNELGRKYKYLLKRIRKLIVDYFFVRNMILLKDEKSMKLLLIFIILNVLL
uniref:Uncharacterized protein n=1 Tax=Bartonella rochalimae ATCC BAA-1498 TaxID=685782 RepID=E6YL56_9HYPH|nr:hypothetical protein BARRO_30175 [Bartonella rochalimae ATCC BAA-1498]